MSADVMARLDDLESMLKILIERQTAKDWYTTEEFARVAGRAEFTVREWCRNGRINAEKKESGRGAYAAWAIPHAELLRFQREGLLPPARNRIDTRIALSTASPT